VKDSYQYFKKLETRELSSIFTIYYVFSSSTISVPIPESQILHRTANVDQIKCDEQKPVCRKCSIHGHNQTCSFLQTHPLKRGPPTVASLLATPSPREQSTPANQIAPANQKSPMPEPLPSAIPSNFTILDLELLHFWTTKSVQSIIDFPAHSTVFATIVPELGFQNPFVMHAILSLSALHLSKLRPEKEAMLLRVSDTHCIKGISLFQPEISNLSSKNCNACFAFSSIIFTRGWASQDLEKPSTIFFRPSTMVEEFEEGGMQWVKLHRGTHEILQALFPALREGPFKTLWEQWKGINMDDFNITHPLPPSEESQLSALTSTWSSSPSLSSHQKEVLDGALYRTKRVFSLLIYHPELSMLEVVMSWFSAITEDYLKMLEDKVPQALLIVAFYCIALKKPEHMWWLNGKGENLLRTVVGELGRGWEGWMEWPVEMVLGKDGKRSFFGKETKGSDFEIPR
jgi:hypothetical protein